MIIHDGIQSLKGIKNAVVTIGTFDGVHLGHQEILRRIIELAKQNNGETALVTFWPHPRFVLKPEDNSLKLLSTFEEKAAILRSIGIDHLIKITFTKEFSQWSSEKFIQEVIISALHTQKLVIGYDHHFGKDREGSFEHLKEHSSRYGFTVEEIPRQDIEDVGISSTKIRKAIDAGEVEKAADFLGRPYEVIGTVIPGDKIGRTLGFPTANISTDAPYKLIPADGTYAVKVMLRKKTYQAMLNIGVRPTVDGKEKRMEAHLFEFDQSIYDEKVTVLFVQKLREEQKFESKEALTMQLAKDKELAIKILND
ncbi:bifunctional riboflavin kinase/FAD synthetase [Marivirga sp. S37H4]|uniref:Riboflavin biosynthesis protein n=1 Tax=Marivirga aurantiaca TaxID=2802615 RepID=A0A934WXT4_9BACT|nr:bifunctional riboflavin kinase/FAD synthetase [Marivirga aurantiaca]MBK6264796.1 bifunctional riboflavin kinase/FAD synthetase [Marivirga aurantiaca]